MNMGTGIRPGNLPSKEIETIEHSLRSTNSSLIAFVCKLVHNTEATSTVIFPSNFDAGESSVNETQVFNYTGTRSNLVSDAATRTIINIHNT